MLLRTPGDDMPARLFCFPYSGMGASMYSKWPTKIGDTELCLVQLPGRENRIREPHYQTHELLAEQLAEELSPYFDRPFGFFGHCGGAFPAFATALHLARHQAPTPACLFVSSQVAPHDGPCGRFLRMSDSELGEELAQLTRAQGGEPKPDVIQMNVGVLRADLTAVENYPFEAPVELPAHVRAIGWDRDAEILPEQMSGWSAYARPGRFHWTMLHGGHYTLLDAPDGLIAELDEGMRPAYVQSVLRAPCLTHRGIGELAAVAGYPLRVPRACSSAIPVRRAQR
jgi:surfactin synthase thioesterase subunit